MRAPAEPRETGSVAAGASESPAPTPPPVRSAVVTILYAVGACLAVLVLSFPAAFVGLAAAGLARAPVDPLDARVFAIIAAATDLSLLAVAAALLAKSRAEIRFRVSAKDLVPLVLACAALAVVNGAGSYAISRTGEVYTGFPVIGLGPWGVVAFFVAGFVAPAAEEIFFREALLVRVFPRSRRAFAVVCTSILFGALHVASGGVVLVVTLFLMGWVLAVLRLRTGSLGPPIVAHGLNNVVALLLSISLAP